MQLNAPGSNGSVNEESPTEELVAWTLKRFANQRIIMTTSFGMEGCALIDMYATHGQPFTVVYLDTMFFFKETYHLRDRLVQRYPHVNFENRGTTLTPEQQADRYGAKLWETNPDLCCKIRKVDPMHEAIADADVWITGLRRSQARSRANLRVVDWDWKFQLLKISPLARWERAQVWDYVKKHDVPYNVLHERGYPTIGCTHCTRVVPGLSIDEYSRAGRWSGTSKTECGLHGDGI